MGKRTADDIAKGAAATAQDAGEQRLREEIARRQRQEHEAILREPILVPTSELQKALDCAQATVPPAVRQGMWEGSGFEPAAPNRLAIPPLTDPVGHARDLSLAAAEICKAKSLLPQSRVQAIRLLNMAIAVLGT